MDLKTGERIEGTLKQATPVSVSVEVAAETITVDGRNVQAIYFGSAPAPTPDAAPDRVALWEIGASYLRQPITKRLQIFGSRSACEGTAARLSRTSTTSTYRCLPYGAQPSPSLTP